MPHADFVHLRVHSAYSLSEGAIKAEKIAGLGAEAQAMPAVAITDTGNLFGALEFARPAPRKGIQPIIGCQIALGPQPTIRACRPTRSCCWRRTRPARQSAAPVVGGFLDTDPALKPQLPLRPHRRARRRA